MKLKALTEKREDLQKEMEKLVNTAEAEERAMTQEEIERFDQLEEEIRAVDETIEGTEKARNMDPAPKNGSGNATEEEEVRAFEDYVLGKVSELRAGEQNVTMGNNGAIIPTSIANRIIKAVEDRCPILAGATVYSVKGNLKVPVWGKANSTHDIAVGYSAEFTELTADAGKFTRVDLGG